MTRPAALAIRTLAVLALSVLAVMASAEEPKATEPRVTVQPEGPCPESFVVFKAEVHPFLRKHCAGCHGDEGKDFDRNEYMAPTHSGHDALKSYMKTRGYLDLSNINKSRFVLIGENGHCVDKGGEEGCGARKGEVAQAIAHWAGLEKSCEVHSNVTPSLAQAMTKNRFDEFDIAALGQSVELKTRTVQVGKVTYTLSKATEEPAMSVEPAKSTSDAASGNIKSALADVKQISAGDAHVCAIVDDGLVKCWGSNNRFQLGNFTGTYYMGNVNDPKQKMNAIKPVDLGARAIQVGAGTAFSCALLETNEVKCWGFNGSKQLGYEPNDYSTKPLKVNIGPEKIKVLSVGQTHSCVLTVGGEVKCWGYNSNNELGYPSDMPQVTDNSPLKALPLDQKVKWLNVGRNGTCIVLENGEVKCWGLTNFAYAGNDTTDDSVSSVASEKPVILGSPAKMAFAGFRYACAVLENEEVKCWGLGNQGQLGQGDKNSIYRKEDMEKLVPIPLGGKVRSLALGDSTVCALLEGAIIKCWGDNRFGEFGSGDGRSFLGATTPNDVASMMPTVLSGRALAVTSGDDFSCAIVIKNSDYKIAGKNSARRAECWGRNNVGQLGLDDNKDRGIFDIGDKEPLPTALIYK